MLRNHPAHALKVFRVTMGSMGSMTSTACCKHAVSRYNLLRTAVMTSVTMFAKTGARSGGPITECSQHTQSVDNCISTITSFPLMRALDTLSAIPCAQILTWGQYAEAAACLLANKVGLSQESYVPNYTKSMIDHFAIHAGEQNSTPPGGGKCKKLNDECSVLI
jgi:hypothetical protein